MTHARLLLGILVLGCGSSPGPPAEPVAPSRSYRILATAESDDEVALIEFAPCCGARVLRTYAVGIFPSDIEGPHGVIPSADGGSFFVSLAHGRPFGFLQQIDLASARPLGIVELGMFPATVDRAPQGDFLWVVNFNFEDPEMQPSSMSVVAVTGGRLTEIARVPTCRMPHGSRLSPDGMRNYSACMMDDLLVEIDARTFAVTRRLRVGTDEHTAHGAPRTAHAVSCFPTWAQPSADGATVFVACNRSAEIVAVDAARWAVQRRWTTPPAPYNLAATPDGRLLVVTQKGPGTTTVWSLPAGRLVATIPGTRGVASGVAVSGDSRYAFVTLEGVGGEPGTVDIIDLAALHKVATVDIGKQAGGIAVLP